MSIVLSPFPLMEPLAIRQAYTLTIIRRRGHETKKEEKGLIVNGRVMTSSTQKKRLHTQGASADTRQPASSNTKRSVFVIKALAFDLKPRAAEQAKGRAFLVNFQVPRERKNF